MIRHAQRHSRYDLWKRENPANLLSRIFPPVNDYFRFDRITGNNLALYKSRSRLLIEAPLNDSGTS